MGFLGFLGFLWVFWVFYIKRPITTKMLPTLSQLYVSLCKLVKGRGKEGGEVELGKREREKGERKRREEGKLARL